MAFSVQQLEQIITRLKGIETRIARLEARAQNVSISSGTQQLINGVVEVVNGTSPESYNIRVVTGNARTQTNWLIENVIAANPSSTYAAGNYVTILLNTSGNNYIIGGGAGGSGSSDSYISVVGWAVSGS